MLIITEKDIENRKSSIKAALNYYTREMQRKHIHSQYEQSFLNGCNSLIKALDNIKFALYNLYLLNEDKQKELIKKTKREIEKVFLASKVHQADLIIEAREIIRSA